MNQACKTAPELCQLVRDLMHQSALLTLDIASHRSKAALRDRMTMLSDMVMSTADAIRHLPESGFGDGLDRPYWDAYHATRAAVCSKCAFGMALHKGEPM